MNLIAKEVTSIINSPEDVYIVHYSHGDTNQTNQYGQRIFCIYTQNLNGSESNKFSIEKQAQKGKIDVGVIEDWYDDLELSVLDDFNDFLKAKSNCTFIYWQEDGHELILDVIKSRFEELNKGEGKVFNSIPTSKRKSLQFLVKKVEAEVPTELKEFIKKFNNQQLSTGFLTNGEENNCFAKKEFNKIGVSVISKVSFFVKLINDSSSKSVVTAKNSGPIDIRAFNPKELFTRMTLGSWTIFIGLLLTFGSGGFALHKMFSDSDVKQITNEKAEIEKDLKDKNLFFEDQQKLWRDSMSQIKITNYKLSEEIKAKDDSLKSKEKKDEKQKPQ